MKSSHKPVEVFGASDLGVQRVVVHDVVPVHTAGTSLQAWRNVAVTDAKCGKIGNYRRGLCEREFTIELQAIGRARDVWTLLHDFRNHATDQGGSVPRSTASGLTSSLA